MTGQLFRFFPRSSCILIRVISFRLQYWLQRQPQWRSSREFETTTRTTTTGLGPQTTGDELEEFHEDQDPDDELTPGKQKMTVVFQPTFDSTIGIYYRKRPFFPHFFPHFPTASGQARGFSFPSADVSFQLDWLRVRRWKNTSGTEQLSIS